MRPLSVFLRELQHRVMRANATMLIVATLLIAVLTLLAGCSTAVRTPAERADEPAPMESEPTLLGTWRSVIHERDDDGNVEVTETRTITLTGTHFFDRLVGADSEGNPFYDRDRAGTATVTGSTVRLEYHDDGEDISVDKEYLLVGNLLFIHFWGSNDPEVGFEQFTRVGEAPAPGAAPPPLRGTWQRSSYYDHHELGDIHELQTVTLTASRAVEYNTRTNRAGELVDDWTDSFGISLDGTILTRTRDEDGTEVIVDKDYFLGGDLLAIHSWWSDEPGLEFEVFERTEMAAPAKFTGTWSWTSINEDEGITWLFSYTFAEDGTLTYRNRRTQGEDVQLFTLTGTFIHDLENLTVLHTITSVQRVRNGESVSAATDVHSGETLRSAYVPTDDANTIRMSPFWREQRYDESAMQWVDRVRFGDYHALFRRQ